MDKELIVYMGMDFGDVDKTAYGLYDPETGKFQEIDEEEYNKFIKCNFLNSVEELKRLMKS